MRRDSLAPEITALRRFFRRLNDVASLRGNPLAMELFGGPNHEALDARALNQRIRSRVMAALESMTPPLEDRSRSAEYARRLRTIVERCDLLGEPRTVVAADLGICERHLYRDRREAFARLADALRPTSVVSEPDVTLIPGSIGDVELLLNLVTRLDGAGRFRDARAVLENLANQKLPPAQRALVTHRLVDALCDEGGVVEGRVVLDRAKHELAKAGCSESELRVIRSEMLAAEALLAKQAGEMSSAIDCAERALAMLRPYHGPNRERARSLVVELSIVLAGALCEAGAFERAVRTVESAKAFVDEHLDPVVATGLHFHSGQAHVLLPWGMNVALQENREAFAIARRSGHARHEAVALGNFSMVHFLSGNYAEAMRYGQKALLVFEHVACPMDLAQELTHVARVAIALGNAAYALELLARAKQVSAGNKIFGAMIDVVESEALTVQRRFNAGAAAARRACLVFQDCSAHRHLAIALCAEARAYAGLTKKRNAISVIRGAIDVAESHGTAYSLLQVYRASAEITGNKHHAAYAAGIDSALRA